MHLALRMHLSTSNADLSPTLTSKRGGFTYLHVFTGCISQSFCLGGLSPCHSSGPVCPTCAFITATCTPVLSSKDAVSAFGLIYHTCAATMATCTPALSPKDAAMSTSFLLPLPGRGHCCIICWKLCSSGLSDMMYLSAGWAGHERFSDVITNRCAIKHDQYD